MITADPPDVQPSPTRGSAFQGDTQVMVDSREAEKVIGEGSLEVKGDTQVKGDTAEGSFKEKSLSVSDLEVAERSVTPERDTKEVKGSWVRAVQGQKVLKKYDIDVQMQDGIGSVMVPEEITKGVAPLWDDFLIGKFLDVAPHIAKVHAIVNKIWTLNNKAQKVEVFEVNETMMKFRILNNADKNRVLRRGMWNIAGVPVVLTKWSPVIEKEKPPTQSIPMWVHIKNVPVKLFSWQGLSFVTSPLGSPAQVEEASNDKKDPIEEGEIQEAQNEETEEVKTKDQTEYKDETTQVQAVNIEEEGKVSEVEGEVETVKEAEWLEITPGKASRSPNTKQKDLEYSQAILTKSRFEVISPENEGKYDEEVREDTWVIKEVRRLRMVIPAF
ncbi:hypothetical protein Rs2_46708 [Raphanus sativus]|nr:hypothetical protein Rs2_46708 [Raphanus sativus]